MSTRFRVYPTPKQEALLLEHCAHARYVWNLALEQWSQWRPGRISPPNYLEQSKQLTEARAEFIWLNKGVRRIQQQALRDFDRARQSFFSGTKRKPSWRKAGRDEGFCVSEGERGTYNPYRLNRRWGVVQVPHVGKVKFRWTRDPGVIKSYRITYKSGQWHISFPSVPDPIPGPGDGSILGIDRGVTIPFVCSDGTTYTVPSEDPQRLIHLQRKLARQKRGSNRRARTKAQIAKLRLKETNRRKDAIEKATTDLASRYDFFRVEDLKIKNMTKSAKGTVEAPGKNVRQKAGLNRVILRSGWGMFVRRLEDKAPQRVERVDPRYTSQTCSVCKTRDPEARESQAVFRCRTCGYTENADINAARNIAAGLAVTGRGGIGAVRPPTNRQLVKKSTTALSS